jgi:hypothetical protein
MEVFNSDGVKKISQLGGGGGGGNINISAGTTSNNLTNVVFSNSNNVSFGLNGSTVTATATVATSLSNIRLSAGTTSNLRSDFTFSNINGVSFGLDNGTITASVAAGGGGSVNFSAGTTSNNLGSVVFSNSNGVSFGLNGSTITASHNGITTQTNQQMTLFATGNTTLSSTGTTNASSIIFRGSGLASVGITNGSILVDVPAGAPSPVNFSAGTTSGNLGSVVFSNSNGISFGLDGSTITASVATSLTNIRVSAGTTSNLLSAITFSNSNGISFGIDASTVTASHNGLTSQSTQFLAITLGGNTAGTTTFHATNNASIFLHGGNNITLSGNGSSITISAAAGGGGGAPTLSYWNNMTNANIISSQDNMGTLYIRALNNGNMFPGDMTVSSMFFDMHGTVSTGAAFTRSLSIGFYTLVNSTQISLAFSVSTSWGSNAANMNMANSFAGPRWVTLQSSQWNNSPSFSQTNYWLALWQNSSSGSQSFSWRGGASQISNVTQSGFMSVESVINKSRGFIPFLGQYSVSFTTAMPNSLHASDMSCVNLPSIQFMPHIHFNNVMSDII